MQIESRHLEQLAIVVESGTLQQAATNIGTSQPALSRMIRTLEARMGMALFERSSRPLKPTALGLELAVQGRAIRNARLRAGEIVELGASGLFGVLKIGAPPFLCASLMSEAIAGFMTSRPNIRVDLIPGYKDELLDKIYQNQIDVIIGPSLFVGLNKADFAITSLFQDVLAIVGRAEHPVMQVACPSAKDLEGVTWVGLPDRSNLRSEMDNALQALGVTRRLIACQSESAGAVLELLRESDFLTILPSYAVKPTGADGLAFTKLDVPNVEQSVCAITLQQRPETKLTADFKDYLRDQVAGRYARRPGNGP